MNGKKKGGWREKVGKDPATGTHCEQRRLGEPQGAEEGGRERKRGGRISASRFTLSEHEHWEEGREMRGFWVKRKTNWSEKNEFLSELNRPRGRRRDYPERRRRSHVGD